MNKKLVLLSAIVLLFSACTKVVIENEGSRFFRETYVTSYMKPSKFVMSHYMNEGVIYIYATIRGSLVKPSDKEFKTLSELYGDTAFNSYVHEPINVRMAQPVSEITVTCKNDIDVEHPAGTVINDLFSYSAESSLKFIQNNYSYDGINVHIHKPLTEVTKEDCTLLSTDAFVLKCKRFPTSGKYELSVRITVGDGTVLENSVTISL